MERNSDNMEILAPAGNMQMLKTAVAYGADAVYLGAKDFNARSKADNFSDEELRLAVSYCHERGVKVYLTLNTLIKTTEIKKAILSVRKADEAGVDAILIQDLGLYLILRKEFPHISFHTSTQMGVHNVYGAKFAERLGFDRVVLSREVLYEDVYEIKENTNVEIETFIHGAHCVSFSGNCYFSAMVSGYSGNRGKCLQLCRKPYTLSDGTKTKKGYMLSAKDICMIESLPKLKKAGVKSLKIEGRLRSNEYVGAVTATYKKALNTQVTKNDIDKLKIVFNRGDFSHAYINDDRAEIIYPIQQNHIGLFVAKIIGTKGNNLILDKKITLNNNDGYKILRDGKEVGSAIAINNNVIFKGKIKKGDSLHLTKRNNLLKEFSKISNKKETNNKEKTSKTQCNMSDIVRFKYELPQNSVVLIVDENTELSEIKADLLIFSPQVYSISVVKKFLSQCKFPVLLDMPTIARGKDIKILEEIVNADLFDGYVANNVYALQLCKDKKILLGQGMNVISSALDTSAISSVESAVIEEGNAIYAYGNAVLMNLTHCPKKQLGYTCSDCKKCDNIKLKDDLGNVFLYRRKKIHYCYWELLNAKTQNLLQKISPNDKILIDARGINHQKLMAITTNPYVYSFNQNTDTTGRFGKGVK